MSIFILALATLALQGTPDEEKPAKKEERVTPPAQHLVRFQVGTHDPRQGANRKRYQVSHEEEVGTESFFDYLQKPSASGSEAFGVGRQYTLLGERTGAAVNPFVVIGWGVYHARSRTESQTLLAGRFGLGVETRAGLFAEVSTLDARSKLGLRGTSLSAGWRF
jgi:hypothetical protein